jgi:ATP-binding cassette subfamily B protein
MTDASLEKREPSKRIGALRGLWPFVRAYRNLAMMAGAALVLTSAVSLTLPLAVRRVVDGFGAGDLGLIDQYFGAALAIAALLALGTGVRYFYVTKFGERVVADIRRAMFDRVIEKSPAYFDNILTGEILSRITTDTTLILSVIGSSVSVALRNILTLIGGLVLLALSSGKLTLLVLAVVPAVIVPIVVLGRRLRMLSRDNQDLIAQSSGRASEALSAVQTVQSFTHEAATKSNFADVTEASYQSARIRIMTRAQMTVVVIFLIFAAIVAVLWVGARDVQAGAMSAGELVQFLIYAVLVAGAVGSLSEVWGELQRAAGATERLVDLLNATDPVLDPAAPIALPSPAKGEITFDAVRFAYPARSDTSALDDISLTVKAGETVALVGPSGAGKSTMLHLLMRFYDPQQGRITLDGIDLRDMARGDFRRHMALVPQDPVIFATSAYENIAFGRTGASRAQVESAARAAAAHDFIADLPQGYDTYLGERGVMLSGGQKQRIAIARAILRDAPVLLLDEATSALDAESERAVQQAVDHMAKGRTVLVVAHRLATVKRADRIVVFDKGRIAAIGTHDALVAEGGLYARLARLQFTDGISGEI